MIIRSGSKGALVEKLQQELKERGYTIDVDASYGPATTEAVKAFQRSQGLFADGIAGPQVYRALGISDIPEKAEEKTAGTARPVRMGDLSQLAKRKEPISKRTERSQVFISYSHKDKRWLERLHVHLKPFTKQASVMVWDDTLIKPGAKWKEEIKQGLASAKAAILLVSADFLASDFITTSELPSLLQAAESEGTVILPVIVSPCMFEETKSLSQFQAVNPPSRPLSLLSKARQEETFVRVAMSVEQAFKS